MAASWFASAAAGAGLETGFANFIRVILEVRKSNALFRKTMEDLEETLENMRPSIRRIDALNRDFDRPEEIKGLKDLMKKGEDLVMKCSKIHRYNYVKKPLYTKKLLKFQDSICRYVNAILQMQQYADIKENLFEIRMLSCQIRNLSIATSSFSSGGGWSSKSGGFVGVCSAPGLKVKPVGLEIPLKDLKEKLLKDDGFSQLIVVSAPGGCGKTTLAISLCQDVDINDRYKGNIFFVNVSKSPNLLVIIQRLFEHMEYNGCNFLSEEDAVNQLENLLRYRGSEPILLVLDDVWSGSESLLEKLRFPIADYKILVTSRFEFPQFGSSYKLKTLNDTDAMTLFCHVASLPNGNSYRPDQDVVNKVLH